METEKNSWIVQVHAALERDEANDASPQLLIWKVPSQFKTNIKQYKPQHWQFGLHHCAQRLDFNDIEAFKVEVARALQLTGDRWDNFCNHVVLEPKKYWEKVYYHSPHARSYTIEEIKWRLSLDALFLVVILQMYCRRNASLSPTLKKVMENSILEVYYNSSFEAFCLVENQIPMELLKRVVGILVTECKDDVGEMLKWESKDWQGGWNIGKCMEWGIFLHCLIDPTKREELFKKRMNNQLQDANSYCGIHILDSIYRILCGWKSLEAIHCCSCPPRYSATYLEACGVTIKGKEFTCFEDISFENGCLLVPFLQVYDETKAILRNLVVHESLTKCNGRWQYAANCYTYFMGGLMRTIEDVILLEKQGVLSIEVGSHDIVVDMWKRIDYNTEDPLLTHNFFMMMADVSNYANRRRYKYWFEFKKQFCSRPWIPLSYLAATIVTIATLIQTYVAIIGSNRMTPHYAP